MEFFLIITIWMLFITLFGLRPDFFYSLDKNRINNINILNINNKVNNILFIFTILFLWFITAFRAPTIGEDTDVYLQYFDIFSRGGINSSRNV